MSALTGAEWLGLILICTLAASLGLWLCGMFLQGASPKAQTCQVVSTDSHFLLSGEEIVDQDAGDLPAHHPVRYALAWPDLRDWLGARFPDLPEAVQSLPDGQTAQFENAQTTLEILRKGAKTKVTLSEKKPHSAAAWHDFTVAQQHDHQAIAALESAPDPIWRTNRDGAVVWQNNACRTRLGDTVNNMADTPPASQIAGGKPARFCLEAEDGKQAEWFELRKVADQGQTLFFASNVTALVEAETAQQAFVQTLTKTFASLTTGLAIFDKSRKLALFNPALLNLTRVPVDFLSAQPDLMDFFDRLREEQVLPEPKIYADWRAQIRDVIAQTNDGLYQDLWTLPNGLSYRVTGRPHPDGAVAFLFEDISAEISLTRRFRSQIELRQSVLDKLDDAIAVFGPNNLLMFCNTPCAALLNVDPESSFADMTLRDMLAAARTVFQSNPEWDAFEERTMRAADSLDDPVNLVDAHGRISSCRMVRLASGVRMLVFSRPSVKAPRKSASAVS